MLLLTAVCALEFLFLKINFSPDVLDSNLVFARLDNKNLRLPYPQCNSSIVAEMICIDRKGVPRLSRDNMAEYCLNITYRPIRAIRAHLQFLPKMTFA